MTTLQAKPSVHGHDTEGARCTAPEELSHRVE